MSWLTHTTAIPKKLVSNFNLFSFKVVWGRWDGSDAFYCSTTAGRSKYWIRIDSKHLTFLSDDQRRDDYTGPPSSQPQFQSMPYQTSSASSHINNRDSFNIMNSQIDNAFNDYSETHCKYETMQHPSRFLKSIQIMDVSLPPMKESGLKVSQYIKKIQSAILMTKASDQTPKLPQFMADGVLPHSIQHIGQTMHQTFRFSNSTRSLSEENVVPNIPRNNDDDDDEYNDPNKPPPQAVSTSSSGPIFRTFEGNLTKHDNSVHQMNILSFNAENNTIKDSFNNNVLVDSSRQCLCRFFFLFKFLAYCELWKLTCDISNLLGKEGSDQQMISVLRK